MLTGGMSAAGPQMILQPMSPMVYLDHWALRVFSSDPALAARLIVALRASHGTLALSWMNLGEYATVADPEQRRQTERLLEDILPNVFCLEVHKVVALDRWDVQVIASKSGSVDSFKLGVSEEDSIYKLQPTRIHGAVFTVWAGETGQPCGRDLADLLAERAVVGAGR